MRLVLGVLLVAATSCPKPPTPPTPTPPPPPVMCLPGVPWCNELVPPATCSTATQPCKHNPTSDPAHCELAPDCPPLPPVCPEACPEGQECTNPAVGCIDKPEPPPAGECPWTLAQYPGTRLGASTKHYGQGIDHTTLVIGSSKYCSDRGWTDGRSVCQVAIDGDPNKVPCELEFGNGCPVFRFRAQDQVRQCVNNQDDLMSCDHFGDTEVRDDPRTPEFEGRPAECAKQTGPYGYEAGFFTIVHGLGEAQSCVDKTFSACGPWLAINH
jgi:hypothetical protein